MDDVLLHPSLAEFTGLLLQKEFSVNMTNTSTLAVLGNKIKFNLYSIILRLTIIGWLKSIVP
jgi:hypothetical protein